jgi:hypothetical protein
VDETCAIVDARDILINHHDDFVYGGGLKMDAFAESKSLSERSESSASELIYG